jgi:Ca-activated chloride channel family protein
MFRLANPDYIYAFALIPVLYVLYLLYRKWKKVRLDNFGESRLVRRLNPDASISRPSIRFFILLVSVILIVTAVCGPLIGSKLEEVKRKGADIIIAVDVSNSMLAEDIKPSRLERTRQAINRLIDNLEGDRIGIIVFAGDAYTQLPITTDYGAAKLFLSTLETDMVPQQGTAIGAAIDLAVTSFSDSTHKHSAVIVITDGENHEDDAIEAAKSAAEKGIKIYTIGMGSLEGGPIPIYNNGTRVGFRQDKDGTTIITKLNPTMLSEIADAGKGKFIRASNSDDGLSLVLKELDQLDKKEFKAKVFSDYENQFQLFLAPAILLLIIEFLIGDKKSKWFASLNLFKIKRREDEN